MSGMRELGKQVREANLIDARSRLDQAEAQVMSEKPHAATASISTELRELISKACASTPDLAKEVAHAKALEEDASRMRMSDTQKTGRVLRDVTENDQHHIPSYEVPPVSDSFVDFVLRTAEGVTTEQTITIAHAFALKDHLQREAENNLILIVTGGELYDWSLAPKADFVINLSRLLRDPAHVPMGELLDKRGDEDLEVVEFVMDTEGAEDLLRATVNLIGKTKDDVPVVIHVMCRGGKHRAPAFGVSLHAALEMYGFGGSAWSGSTVRAGVAIHHLHAHLPRVIAGEK